MILLAAFLPFLLAFHSFVFRNPTCRPYQEPKYDPSPNPSSVVKAGHARFTVITDRIVRMEWGGEVDAATFGILNRNLPSPSFQHRVEGGVLTIITNSLKVGSTGYSV